MNAGHFACFFMGTAMGAWMIVGITKYYQWRTKIELQKQKAEWYDEDHKNNTEV